MSTTWQGPPPPTYPAATVAERVRGAIRLGSFAVTTVVLLVPFLTLRVFGGTQDRWVAKAWSHVALRCLGLRLERIGQPIGEGLIAANHVSWIDPLALGAAANTFFVAKREVSRWPIIGTLCRFGRVEFVTRARTDAHRQTQVVGSRVHAGHLLSIFPEGTSSDGQQVLPFRSTLFAALFDVADRKHVQPVAIRYVPLPESGLPTCHYGWWGEMGFAEHLWNVLCRSRQGRVQVAFLPPLAVDQYEDRKALAAACERAVGEQLASASAK